MMMKAGIRTLLGIWDLTRDTTMLDINNTNKVAIPIPKPLYADEVTPNVGHIPRSITKMGFSLTIPFKKFCF
ncbi:MAG: hypothetical protein TRG1_1845 [Flavobacteriaceae bacterium FS1-H7996/R]|nr:MAG: hypothetical protein TRG1_1845 [Flavobacteriaceae bacterium FS1-H7996/R]